MPKNIISGIKRYIANHINSNQNLKHISLSFFGGEPLLEFYNVVMPIIEATKELCLPKAINMHVHFTTNAGMFTDEMIAQLKPYNPSFQITLDGGRESHDNTRFFKGKKPSFDLILDNIFKLVEAGLEVLVRINYTHKNIESTKDVIERLNRLDSEKRRLVKVDFQQVWQDRNNDETETATENMIRNFRETLRESKINVTYSRLFNYVLNSCYADKRNEILINFNGDLFACTARDFKPENRMGVLQEDGAVAWENDAANKRMNCRFKKAVCRKCRIAPICGGGCRTKCLEQAHHEQCNLNFTDNKINDIILERFEQYFMK